MPAPRTAVMLVAVGAILAVVGFAAWTRLAPRSPEQREPTAAELLAGIHVSVSISATWLVATHAIADFGIDEGVRLVLVRSVDGLALSLTLATDRDVSFAESLRFCLVGPYSAPDDAGLESPCWGEPDLGTLEAAQLPTDAAGYPMLAAGRPLTISADPRRGDVRCDCPPGSWVLEFEADPIGDGSPAGPRYLPDVSLEVTFDRSVPLALVARARYCGLATAVFGEQGEPAVVSPES